MTKLHFNYKDIFRALRLGFSAKKIWMSSVGLLFTFAGYAIITYLAYLAAGVDILSVWQMYRLLPFPSPLDYAFPWYAWVIYGIAIAYALVAFLITGTAVSKVAYEQLRGDEFFEAKEAFRFAFKNAAAVVTSPLLVLAFVALIVVLGLVLSAIGAIPVVGEILIALFAIFAFIAALFIVYLLVVFCFAIAMGPGVVGTTRSDTFDSLFEVFSCVNEQPARLTWYTAIVAFLSWVGCSLMSAAASCAGRIAAAVLGVFMGDKLADVIYNASFYYKISLPDWWPAALHQLFVTKMNLLGLSQAYMPGDYISISWANDIASLFLGVTFYAVTLIVVGYGCSVWFSGMTLNFAVLAQKKDEKNILEIPEDEEELIEPVPNEALKDLKPKPAEPEKKD